MSRARQAKPAVREAMKARILISAPSGAGKTRSALAIARELVGDDGKIVVIDTEEGSARIYADDFDFDVIDWAPPFNPSELAATIKELSAEYDAVICDSASHFWKGEGGTLDIADRRFGGWKDATPVQDELVSAILRAKSHVIICARTKQEYAVGVGPDGKQKVDKLGTVPIQREGLEYEFTVHLRMDMAHNIDVDKTRCSLLAGRTFRPGRGVSEFGSIFGQWLSSGAPLADSATVKALVARLNALPADIRKTAKSDFVTSISRPEALIADQVENAEALVSLYETEAKAATTSDESAEPEQQMSAALAVDSGVITEPVGQEPSQSQAPVEQVQRPKIPTPVVQVDSPTPQPEPVDLAMELEDLIGVMKDSKITHPPTRSKVAAMVLGKSVSKLGNLSATEMQQVGDTLLGMEPEAIAALVQGVEK